jgi:hypothetical protein
MSAFAQSLTGSPELFPHVLDPRSGVVGFIRLTENDYRAASFLDERVLTPGTLRRSIPWSEVKQAIDQGVTAESCHYIFHIGHVGSTLLSRLIGGQKGVLGLREPGILRLLAQIRGESGLAERAWGEGGFEEKLGVFLKLWSRTFRDGDRVALKATSYISEIAGEILGRPAQPKALLMAVSAESYLATILGGENAPAETMALAPSRLKRLQARVNIGEFRLEQARLGEVVAMSWACEITALLAAKRSSSPRSFLLNFDTFLRLPHDILFQALRHLDIPATEADVDTLLAGPDMRRYSKAPEHAYDADLRRQVLDQARATSGDEIRRGLAWLDRMAAEHSPIAEAMKLTT